MSEKLYTYIEPEQIRELLGKRGIDVPDDMLFGRMIDKVRAVKWNKDDFTQEEVGMIEELGGEFWEKKKRWREQDE
jgi:hypothetical protein